MLNHFENIIQYKIKKRVVKPTKFEYNDIEVEVSDIKKIQYILEQIGLHKTFTMEKYRLKWKYNDDVELNLDELPFGVFLEIHGNEKDVLEASKDLGLNVKNAKKGTYWDIFEEFKTKITLILV